jgi:hypothetical protein
LFQVPRIASKIEITPEKRAIAFAYVFFDIMLRTGSYHAAINTFPASFVIVLPCTSDTNKFRIRIALAVLMSRD